LAIRAWPQGHQPACPWKLHAATAAAARREARSAVRGLGELAAATWKFTSGIDRGKRGVHVLVKLGSRLNTDTYRQLDLGVFGALASNAVTPAGASSACVALPAALKLVAPTRLGSVVCLKAQDSYPSLQHAERLCCGHSGATMRWLRSAWRGAFYVRSRAAGDVVQLTRSARARERASNACVDLSDESCLRRRRTSARWLRCTSK